MRLDNNQNAFIALVRAGLWEEEVHLSRYGELDFMKIFQIAEEQSVVGLVAAGLEHVGDVKVPQEVALTFAGITLQLEQRNGAMNDFVGTLIGILRRKDIYTLLVKGQGIAQCYERPLWRVSGDVDFFLSDTNYEKAKNLLLPLASVVEDENSKTKHLGMRIEGWEVELHGSLRGELNNKIDKGLDKLAENVFIGGSVRSWMNGSVQVFLPGIDIDAVYIFSHILQHFFRGGIGIRQICDWCRLLWTYRDSLDYNLIESRIKSMGLMNEWKVFGSLAVDWLGMPKTYMPFYDARFSKKGSRILEIVMKTGNFGHKLDTSYRQEKDAIKRKWRTFYQITSDTMNHFYIFPSNSIKVWWNWMLIGLRIR